jgi:hypothetical protein
LPMPKRAMPIANNLIFLIKLLRKWGDFLFSL